MKKHLLFSTVCCSVLLWTSIGSAERKSPLEGQPAVRHRYELRKNRFELGPSVGFTIDRALRNAVLFGVKLEYHLNDYLSLGADFGYGVNYDTGLAGELEDGCLQAESCQGPASNPNREDKLPWDTHKKRFSNIQAAGDVRISFTPLSGKLGIFSKLFMGYDMYAFAGLGIAILSNEYDDTANSERDNITQGFRPGPAFGLGVHLFFNNFISLGVELKDLLFYDNQSGGDITRGLQKAELEWAKTHPAEPILIDGDDQDMTNHWMASINLTFFLPTAPAISR